MRSQSAIAAAMLVMAAAESTTVRNNTDAISEHICTQQEVRYVRLLIETGEQNDGSAYGRISEMEVYSPLGGAGSEEQK